MQLLIVIVIALVTIITNQPLSFIVANTNTNTTTTTSIDDAINMAAPIIQMIGQGLGNPVVPQPTFAGVNVQLNANGMGKFYSILISFFCQCCDLTIHFSQYINRT